MPLFDRAESGRQKRRPLPKQARKFYEAMSKASNVREIQHKVHGKHKKLDLATVPAPWPMRTTLLWRSEKVAIEGKDSAVFASVRPAGTAAGALTGPGPHDASVLTIQDLRVHQRSQHLRTLALDPEP